MDNHTNDSQESVRIFHDELVAAEPLATARAAIDAGAEDALTAGLVALLEARLGDRQEAICRTMSLFESTMDRDPTTTVQLMASLYSLAARTFLHEICDAIDIWIDEYHPPGLAQSFRNKAGSAQPDYMRAKYAEWAARLESATTPRTEK